MTHILLLCTNPYTRMRVSAQLRRSKVQAQIAHTAIPNQKPDIVITDRQNRSAGEIALCERGGILDVAEVLWRG